MRGIFGVALAACLSSTGCSSPAYHDGYGTLLVDWTVDGSKRPAACRAWGADAIDIVIYDHHGVFVDEFTEYCETFAVAITLYPGPYTVDAALFDVSGRTLTSWAHDRTRVYWYETTVSPLDFPASSFF